MALSAFGKAPRCNHFFTLSAFSRNSLHVILLYSTLENLAPRLNLYKTGSKLDILWDGATAASSKSVAVFFTNPLYMLKTRVETGTIGKQNTILNDVKAIYNSNGIRGFYKGFLATVLRDVPYQMTQFMIYKSLGTLLGIFPKNIGGKKVEEASPKQSESKLPVFFVGSVSSMLACMITQPFDTARVGLF